MVARLAFCYEHFRSVGPWGLLSTFVGIGLACANFRSSGCCDPESDAPPGMIHQISIPARCTLMNRIVIGHAWTSLANLLYRRSWSCGQEIGGDCTPSLPAVSVAWLGAVPSGGPQLSSWCTGPSMSLVRR